MKRVGSVIVVLLGLWGPTSLFAQNLSPLNWYFGNSKDGIRFNRTTQVPALVKDQAIPFGTGGSAVATDPTNGDLLFYTDGNKVYDVTHKVMPNGTLAAGPSSNQRVAICPVPGSTTQYAIFTNSASFATSTVGTITFTVVDMALFGNSASPSPPFGDVVPGPKNVSASLPANRAEGMIIVPDATGKNFWLISSAINSTTVDALYIDANFFLPAPPPVFIKSSPGAGYASTAGNYSFFAKTSKIAVAPQDPNTDAFILTFNNSAPPSGVAGLLTLDRVIFNTGVASTVPNPALTDIEFDPKGQYLYISRPAQPGVLPDLIQYDYINSDPLLPTTILSSVIPSTPVANSFGVQMGPDSALYYIYQKTVGGPFLVDTFTKTDTIASQVIRHTTPLGTDDFAGTQFPVFLPASKPVLTADFTVDGTCQNTPVSFYPIITPNADSLKWDFGDGSDTVVWSPIHTFKLAQPSFNVKLTAYLLGDSVVVTKAVPIQAFALQLDLVQDTTACHCAFPIYGPVCGGKPAKVTVKVTGGTASSYIWSNGDTGPNLTPDSAGYYYVVVSDGSGCSAYKGVNVKEHLLQDQRRNIWYFGNNAGIDFNQSPPVALNTSAMIAPEGCAIVCDRNGQTIFYTNGDQVFDKTNTQIASGIGGNTGSTQSSLIFPVPGDETLYYIFTTQEINGTSNLEARYSLFDLKKNSGKGLVTQQNVLLFARSTERLTGSDNWVIYHEYGNNTFRAYPVSAGGIGDPVYTAIGSDHSIQFPGNGEGYMKLGPLGELAVAISNGSGNFIELFHFNDSTGTLSNFRRIDLNEPAGQVYGIEFSPGGTKLYATIRGTPSKYIEYYLDSLQRPHFMQSIPETADLGAIQVAPDDEVFVAMNDAAHSAFLGTIQVSEDTTQVSPLMLNGFALAGGTTSTYGLPNFRQQINNGLGGPGITATGLCFGDSTKFAGSRRDELDQFVWDFGDGSGLGKSDNGNPAHKYGSPGTYTVTMTLVSKCGDSAPPFQKVITINDKPALPTINPPQSLCNGPITLNANSGNIPGLTYKWSTGDTTKLKTIDHKIFISVINTNQFGCFRKDSTVVGDARPFADLGPDQTVCQKSTVKDLTANNPPGTVYQWVLNGAITGTGPTQPVSTAVANSAGVPQFVYSVTVTFPNTCTAKDTVAITVNVVPDFVLTKTDPSVCLAADGQIKIQLNTSAPPGGPLYAYFVTGSTSFSSQNFDQSPGTINVTGLTAAESPYTVLVEDQISGCVTQNNIGLSDATFTVTPTSTPACDPVPVTVNTTAVAFTPATPLVYTATENTTGIVTSGTSPTANFIQPLVAGDYIFKVTDNNGCSKTANYTVVASPPANITITPNLCTSPATLLASGSSNYTWDPSPNITGPLNQPSVQLVLSSGLATFTVHATPPGPACAGTQNTTVDITSITPNFTQSDPCSTPVLLTATPNGNYVYTWFLNGVQLPTGGNQVLVTTGGSYSVSIFNPGNSCTLTSPVKTVTVGEILVAPTITVDPSPPCDDGTPFTLTAATTSTGVTYSWSLNGTVISGANTAVIQQTAPGDYVVSIVKTVSCPPSLGEFPINRIALPVGALPDRVVICNDPENTDTTSNHVRLDPGSFASYNWFKDQNTTGVTDRVFVAESEGIYMVELTNSYGCVGTDQTEVDNLCIPKIVAPTAFRPSSSQSANTDFYVFSYFITDNFQIFIYNRWGELIYQSDNRYFKWNGNLNNSGNPLPGGTYAYVIKYTSSFEPEKGIQEKHGGVVLLR